jgi:hypothetical protein
MGIAIRCILEEDVPGVPHMEGKSLAMAYMSHAVETDGEDPEATAQIIAVDFGSGKPATPPAAPAPAESLFGPLDPFVAGDRGVPWHDPAKGLVAVRSILKKLSAGATVELSPEIGFFEVGGEDGEELTEAVRCDLEELEQILVAAGKAGARFHLAFDL